MSGKDTERGTAASGTNMYQQAVYTYGCIVLWIGLSAAVILINKYVLAYSGFSYPVALTICHMAFCSILAFLLVHFRVVDAVSMDRSTYLTCVVPISALFAGTLWLGNAAYLYLSVAFIQMLKATMPITVFVVGIMLGTEKFSPLYAANMVVVGVGVATASFGELNFDVMGVMFQSGSIIAESFRLALVQILLQQRGIKLNPVSTLYYIAPACFFFLLVPFLFIELPQMQADESLQIQPMWILASAMAAFGLNMSVFLLIGKTSALTMNVAGVLKDWLLIGVSVLLYKSPVTSLQLGGYAVAFLGVCWYNYQKIQQMKAAHMQRQTQQALAEISKQEAKPLLAEQPKQ